MPEDSGVAGYGSGGLLGDVPPELHLFVCLFGCQQTEGTRELAGLVCIRTFRTLEPIYPKVERSMAWDNQDVEAKWRLQKKWLGFG